VNESARALHDATARDAALDVADVALLATVTADADVTVIGEQEPPRARIRRVELGEDSVGLERDVCVRCVHAVLVTGGGDAKDVNEHERGGTLHGLERARLPLRGPHLRRRVLRGLRRIRGGLGPVKPERAHDVAIVLCDRGAARDLRRDAVLVERRNQRTPAAVHDARLLLRQSRPQRDLDGQ